MLQFPPALLPVPAPAKGEYALFPGDPLLRLCNPDVPIIDGVLPVYGVPESELSDYLRPEGLFLFIHHNIR